MVQKVLLITRNVSVQESLESELQLESHEALKLIDIQ
jgi:hypothetical protein